MIHSIPLSDFQETGLASIHEELKVVQLLFDISQVLNKSLSLEESLQPVLGKMAEQAGMKEVAITLFNRETGGTELNLAYGLSKEERSKRRLRQEITNRVVETGFPAVAERFSQKPRLLHRNHDLKNEIGQRTESHISFISVPIHGTDGIIGVIGADRLFPEKKSVEEDVRLLTRIAGLLADAIEIRIKARNQQRILREKAERLQSEIMDHFKPANIIGNSHAIQILHQLINQVSRSHSHVLITGETGTGKELVARAIHVNSPRAQKPFIKLSIAALSSSTIGSEMFGSDPAKLTGTLPKGCFEMASGGTLFLDEICHLPMPVQTGLLRVLQEIGSAPLGTDPIPELDVRIISATSSNLETLVQNSEFRLDLFYRLNAFPIFVPPLRERKTDIVLLADHFVERAAKKHSKPIHRISPHSLDLMMSHHWPGNVRELENCIERAVLLSSDGAIHAHLLPPSLQKTQRSDTQPQGNLQASLAVFEQDMIVDALKSALGNSSCAARLLGINEMLMSRRIKKYGIDVKRFRPPGVV